MSYTQFVCTSKCQVADDFNLEDYLKSLVDFVGNHVDDLSESVTWLTEMEYDDVITEFEKYVWQNGNEVLINCDTEEDNHDTDLWDWLSDQIRQDVMISKFMTINSTTIDSREGVDPYQAFVMKDGTQIGPTEISNIVEQYVKMSS
jgi:translation initiation factor 2 alpha subunit (eIF-2alpha)